MYPHSGLGSKDAPSRHTLRLSGDRGQAMTRRASLELLRAEAKDELDTVIVDRCRAGEDPWDFMDDLPTVDELVVSLLRSEYIVADDSRMPGAARDYRILRQIGLEHPGLTTTVWRMLGGLDPRETRVS
jgi:hypothetical protein